MFPLFSSLKDPNLTSIVGHWGTNWLTNFLLRARAYQLTTSFDYSCNKREFNNNAAGTKVTCGQHAEISRYYLLSKPDNFTLKYYFCVQILKSKSFLNYKNARRRIHTYILRGRKLFKTHV